MCIRDRFDTGCHPSVETNAEKRWGGLSKIMKPKNMNGINLISELNKKNIKPTDIDIVINSHLHPDHCGCNEFFTNAEFYCHNNEFHAANSSDAKRFGYIKNEWDLPMGLKTINEEFDFFNNSKIVTIDLFGHTPGSIGLLVNLDKNQFLIASDAVSLLRNLAKLEENSIEISLLCNWLMPFQNDINNILEIGSGAGNKLSQLCWQLNASGQGVDPSKTAVDFANKKYNQKCSYTVATADYLSFFKNKFDLVHFGFCLYLVSRNKINDVIKQADQLLKSGKFLSIIDFDPHNSYENESVSYTHLTLPTSDLV